MTKPKAKLITEAEYTVLLARANELVGCCEEELELIAALLDAYETAEAQALLANVPQSLGARKVEDE